MRSILVLNTKGVVSLLNLEIIRIPEVEKSNVYWGVSFDPSRYINRCILYPLQGGIFELKLPSDDIIGTVV